MPMRPAKPASAASHHDPVQGTGVARGRRNGRRNRKIRHAEDLPATLERCHGDWKTRPSSRRHGRTCSAMTVRTRFQSPRSCSSAGLDDRGKRSTADASTRVRQPIGKPAPIAPSGALSRLCRRVSCCYPLAPWDCPGLGPARKHSARQVRRTQRPDIATVIS
jgi:hypothetical protein